MPKNKGKGGKNRRRGKNENEGQKRDLIYRDEGQRKRFLNVSVVGFILPYFSMFYFQNTLKSNDFLVMVV